MFVMTANSGGPPEGRRLREGEELVSTPGQHGQTVDPKAHLAPELRVRSMTTTPWSTAAAPTATGNESRARLDTRARAAQPANRSRSPREERLSIRVVAAREHVSPAPRSTDSLRRSVRRRRFGVWHPSATSSRGLRAAPGRGLEASCERRHVGQHRSVRLGHRLR